MVDDCPGYRPCQRSTVGLVQHPKFSAVYGGRKSLHVCTDQHILVLKRVPSPRLLPSLFSFFLHVDNTSENYFYSCCPLLGFPKKPQIPTWLMTKNPRSPRVRYLLTLAPSERMAVRLCCGCIESGDDLCPDFRGLAFGRLGGVGFDGRLTGLLFSLLS